MEAWEPPVAGQTKIKAIWSHIFRAKTLEPRRTGQSKIVETFERNQVRVQNMRTRTKEWEGKSRAQLES